MNPRLWLIAILLSAAAFWIWRSGESRRTALVAVNHLADGLASPQKDGLLNTVLVPRSLASLTPQEQTEFLVKALADEISPEGVQALKQHAEFGPVKSVFPNDYSKWCNQAGANPDDCVAFKMERAGISAEVVLLREGETYRVVRCNNVKQMAGI